MKRLTVPYLYWGLCLAQAAHSVEECLTRLPDWAVRGTASLNQYLGIVPVFSVRLETFAAFNVALVAAMSSLTIFLLSGRPWALRVARGAAIIEIANGCAHGFWAIYFREYFSGVITAPFLAVIGLLLWRSLRGGESTKPAASYHG